jgi:hypothetical protein
MKYTDNRKCTYGKEEGVLFRYTTDELMALCKQYKHPEFKDRMPASPVGKYHWFFMPKAYTGRRKNNVFEYAVAGARKCCICVFLCSSMDFYGEGNFYLQETVRLPADVAEDLDPDRDIPMPSINLGIKKLILLVG